MTKTVRLKSGHEAIIDDVDESLVLEWNWYYNNGRAYGYLRGSGNVLKFMHRLIMNPPDDMQVDHINGNGLDNRRCNLRICTSQQNHWNTTARRNPISRHKGVRMDQGGHWSAYIAVEGNRQLYLGYYSSEEDAAIVYNKAARLRFGEFANLNDVLEDHEPIRRTFADRNKSGYYGVHWDKARGKWSAKVRRGKKSVYLGRYDDIVEAAMAVNSFLEKEK